MRTPKLQIPTTTFLTTLMTLLLRLPQIPVTIFLMTSSFMQNSQLFDNHQTLHHLSCQERKLRLPLAFLQNVLLQRDSTLTPMPNALHIYGTNAKINARNDAKLNDIDGELFTIKAKNASRLVKTFQVNNAGCIRNTPFQAVLKLKVGCEVILVHNIDTLDGLTNGCRGVLVAIETTGDRKPKRLVIKFKNPEHGRLRREKNPCHRHPGATYIDPILWRYILGGATATILQFPVRGAAAISAHKFQVFYFDIKLASFTSNFLIDARNFIKMLTSQQPEHCVNC